MITSEDSKHIDDLEYGSKWLRNSVYLFYNNLAAKELRLVVNLAKSFNLVPVEGDFTTPHIRLKLDPHESKFV